MLAESPDRRGLSVGQLADALLTRRGDVTRSVDRLVNAGFVQRSTVPEDRRKALVRLSPASRNPCRRVKAKLRSRHIQPWSGLHTEALLMADQLLQKARPHGGLAERSLPNRT